ncbi:MAG: hypothetical protein AMXMBFR53_36810 [Gemmatimonadota bacterium]
MTIQQMRGMLAFHEKMARAYRAVGKVKDAEAAERRAAELVWDLEMALEAPAEAGWRGVR